MRFSVNSERPLEVYYPVPRPDVKKKLWQRPNAESCGFTVVIPREHSGELIEFRCADTQTGALDDGRQSFILPDPGIRETLPDEDRRFRVVGNRDPYAFLLAGATDAFRVKRAYENYTGTTWPATGEEARRVLDFGVGCGRLARHLAPSLGANFSGCDLDADNLSWCAENLAGSYAASRLDPPLPYADGQFDIIYGVSVFTHLTQTWEQAWLTELHRVLKPGGIILMTVHGQTAIDFAGLAPGVYEDLMERVRREGLVVTGRNPQLDGFIECPAEYVNVFHSKKHIQEVWGRLFERIEILPAYLYTHDLVVARKPTAARSGRFGWLNFKRRA